MGAVRCGSVNVGQPGGDTANMQSDVARTPVVEHLPELREVAEPIVWEWIEEDVELRWMEGVRGAKCE